MIELYTAATPNGWKAAIMLEEIGLPYNVRVVNIAKDEQFQPSFLQISPNNKIPAIVDPDGPDGQPISVFESAAILMYLARKTKSPLLPTEERAFTKTMEWLFFQMASVGPMFGQMGHFRRFAKEKIPYAIDRYTNESKRILGVMNTQLGKNAYLAGPDYTIADIATYGWTLAASRIFEGLGDCPDVQRWFDELGARPAVKKGIAVPPAQN
jgi:GST-like protein